MPRIYSWSRFAGRVLAASLERSVKPLKMVFVVTKRCHSRCVYCDIWKVKDLPGAFDAELSLEEVVRVARANPYLQWIDFTGGEPTDRADLVEVIEAFASHCPDLLLVHFPTNGIATKRILEVCGRLRASVRARLVVTVSIDGPPELNDRLRGIRNDFAHAVDTFVGLRRLLGAQNVFVGMTLHGFSKTCGMTTKDLMLATHEALGLAFTERGEAPLEWESFHLNIPHISQHYYANAEAKDDGFGGVLHRTEVAEALSEAAVRSKRREVGPIQAVERVYRKEAQLYLRTGRTRIPCSALLQTIYLSEKGDLFPCTIWNKPLGNVRSTDYAFMPLVEKARQAGVREQVRRGQCPNCWTPCEAYPSIMASPWKSLQSLLSVGGSLSK